MITIVRLSTWDEIQEAILWAGNHPPKRVSVQNRYDVVNWSGGLVGTFAALQGVRGCALCGHRRDVHSEILSFAPCLDCDCIGWTVLTPPNPTRRERW